MEKNLTRLLLNHGLSPDDEVAEKVDNFYGQTTAMIERSLRRGMEIGIVRRCDPEFVAAVAMGGIRGVVLHLIAKGDEVDLDKATDEFIAFALRGVVLGGS